MAGRYGGRISREAPTGRRLTAVAGIVVIAALGLVGCAGHTSTDMQARSLYITEHPDMSGSFAQAIMAGQIMIGMTPEMIQAAWGRPQRVETRRPAEPAGAEAITPAIMTPGEGTTTASAAEAIKTPPRVWETKLVYGNYLMNRMVTNLYFAGGRLTVIENVDTNGASAVSMTDPDARILLPGQAPPQSGPAKGGGQ